MSTITLHLTDRLGSSLSVEVDAEGLGYLEALRKCGRLGLHSGEIPRGGIRVPLANEEDFDWSLLGGQKFADKDTGEIKVFCRGHVWTRRELAEDKKKKMPAIVKYSRGAKATDPADLREGGADDIQYITLIVFSGTARKIAEYATPKQQERR
jgi:hypothetical protein